MSTIMIPGRLASQLMLPKVVKLEVFFDTLPHN